jgi:hypothetical protein
MAGVRALETWDHSNAACDIKQMSLRGRVRARLRVLLAPEAPEGRTDKGTRLCEPQPPVSQQRARSEVRSRAQRRHSVTGRPQHPGVPQGSRGVLR